MEITKCLTISTAHIRQSTQDLLDKEIKKTTIEGIVVYAKEDYGWFIYLYPEMDHFATTAPADLKACIDLAIKNDCQMLCLDSDAEILDCLPHYTEVDLTSVQADEILEAYDALSEMVVGMDAHWAVKILRNMMCDFDEFRWNSSTEEERQEWLKQFLN